MSITIPGSVSDNAGKGPADKYAQREAKLLGARRLLAAMRGVGLIVPQVPDDKLLEWLAELRHSFNPEPGQGEPRDSSDTESG